MSKQEVSKQEASKQEASTECNVVVISGRLARPAETRVTPSGDVILTLELSTAGVAGRETVPVSWESAPGWASNLTAGDEIVVLGRVRRRFFRVGGATQSRTEVVAAKAVPLRRRMAAAAAVTLMAEHLIDDVVGALTPG